MSKIVEDIILPPISEGIVADGVASYYVAPQTSVSYAQNFHNDRLGMMTLRRPIGASFTPDSTNEWSAALFQPSGSANRLYYQIGTSLKYYDLGALTTTTYTSVFPASYTARYSILQGNLIMTNGSNVVLKYTTGASAPANIAGITGVPSDIDLINAGFVGRIWYASSTNSNNRVFYSDVIPAAGVASATGTSQYLTINAGNGDYVTGFAQGQQVLFTFTHNGIFRIFNTQSQDNAPISNVGAPTQECITLGSDGIYFAHPSGFYKLSETGQVQNISSKIKSLGYYQASTGDFLTCRAFAMDDYVYFSFLQGFNNNGGQQNGSIVYRYNINTQVWTIYTFMRNVIKATATSVDRSGTQTIYLLGTSTDGSRDRFASTFSEQIGSGLLQGSSSSIIDNSTVDVVGTYITQWYDFGAESHLKRIQGIAFPNDNANGFDVAYQVDYDEEITFLSTPVSKINSKWRNIGRLDSNAVTYFKDFVSVPFNKIRFRIMGTSRMETIVNGTYCSIGSPTILKLVDMGYDNTYGKQ